MNTLLKLCNEISIILQKKCLYIGNLIVYEFPINVQYFLIRVLISNLYCLYCYYESDYMYKALLLK